MPFFPCAHFTFLYRKNFSSLLAPSSLEPYPQTLLFLGGIRIGHPDFHNTMGGDCQTWLPAFFPSPHMSKIAIADFIPQTRSFLQAAALLSLAFHDDTVRKDSLSIKAIFPAFHDGINNSKPIEAKGITRKESPKIKLDRIFPADGRHLLQSLVISPCDL
jgi:hypothetical protein